MIGPLAIGTPVEAGAGTGVARYAANLRQAAYDIGLAPLRINAGSPIGAWRRRLRALRPGARAATRTVTEIAAPDLFREAQIHFDLYRRPLQLCCPGPPGIAHWAYPVPLKLRNWTNVYTVHDAIPLLHPSLTTIDAHRHRRLLEALLSFGRIVTVSETAREDIARALRLAVEAILNLGQPVTVEGGAEALPIGLKDRSYFLYCGTLEKRKNVDLLIAAHARSRVVLPLILAGPLDVAKDFGSNVRHIGYQSRADLLRLMAGARALLMPSLAEGFGLPVAEAMQLGTPVMTSNEGALREIAGEAALTIDVADVDAMAQAIATLARDDELCQSLATRGRERGRAFAPDLFADRLRQYYEMISG